MLITVCYYGAYRLRFEGDEPRHRSCRTSPPSLPVVLGCKLPALYASGLYQRSWDTFGLRDLAAVVRGVGHRVAADRGGVVYLYRGEGSRAACSSSTRCCSAAAIIATRVSFRAMNLVASTRSKRSRRVLVYGAGGFGQLLVREMRANPHWRMNPVGFIDDDPLKAHRWIVGVPVRGTLDRARAA